MFFVLKIVLNTSFLQAGVGSDLLSFFKRFEINQNFTSAGSYKDQSGGYYTGGSLIVRNKTRNAQIANIQMPSFRAGCGGIDLWAGGFSHISSEAMVEMLRNIGSSTASYAFMLAIQTVSPQIYNIMNELNNLSTKVNQTNINSCEVAATMLGGVWSRSDQSSQYLCRSMGSQLGSFSDYASARQGCGAKGDRSNILNKKSSDPKYQDMLVGSFNLAWKALQKNDFLISDVELSEVFMTLVGSIISIKNNGDDGFNTFYLASGCDNEELLQGLLYGGSITIYKCDESKDCLKPVKKTININAEYGFLNKVKQILEGLIDKIYEDKSVTNQEIAFLNSTSLPIYKMLNVLSAFRKGYAPVDVVQYGQIIAFDILYRYVMEVIDVVQESLTQMHSVQIDDIQIERFLKQLKQVRQKITLRRQSAYQQMDSMLTLIQTTQMIEKQLHLMLSNLTLE